MNIDEIWAQYQNALRQFLHSKVANDADVDDLLQDILIKSYKNLDTVRDPKNIKAWLFQVAHNTIVDFYRNKSRQQDFNAEELSFLNDDDEVRQAIASCIVPFISALPQEQAQLIMAIDIENNSQKHYAEQLGISYSTLKSRVQKSRTMLRAVFDECCHFKTDSLGNLYEYERKAPGCDVCN